MTATVRAAQLVYSNVEAEHSPTNRRGFQVWLCSPRLKEHQREVARRLEDFEWPAADQAADRVTARLTFFRASSGDYVLARTVPLTERDALGRAGRFHAHAVAVPPDEFAKVGNDPFRVLDAFPFQDGPAPLIASGAWQSGSLPDGPVRVGPPRVPDPAFRDPARRLLPLVARWLDADDARAAAVAVPPERLAAFLRELLRGLPPTLRARATFDTLSTGQSLGALPYRFAGGYDAAAVRDWSYRRAYRLDLEAGEFTTPPAPPPHPGLDRLAATWAADPALTDADREASYYLLKAIHDKPTADVPTDLPAKAIELVGAAGVDDGLARRLADRLTTDLPFPALVPLVSAVAKAWVGPLTREALVKLAEPIAPEWLADWLMAHAEATPLTPDEAAELERFACDLLGRDDQQTIDAAPAKLYLIGLRYQPGSAPRVAELRSRQGWPRLLDGWFREWFLARSLVRDFLTTESASVELAEAVFQSSSRLSPEVVPDLECLLAITGVGPADKRLAFAVEFRRANAGRMSWLLGDRGDLDFARWVVLRGILAGVSVEVALDPVGGEFPGVVLTAGPHVARASAEALFEALAEHPHTKLVLYERASQMADQVAPAPLVFPAGALDRIGAAYEGDRWDRVEAELDKLAVTDLRAFLADKLHDKSRVSGIGHSLGDGAFLWVGPVIESNNNYPEQFAKLYPRVLAAVRRNPLRTAERAAALLAAVRVRTGG